MSQPVMLNIGDDKIVKAYLFMCTATEVFALADRVLVEQSVVYAPTRKEMLETIITKLCEQSDQMGE